MNTAQALEGTSNIIGAACIAWVFTYFMPALRRFTPAFNWMWFFLISALSCVIWAVAMVMVRNWHSFWENIAFITWNLWWAWFHWNRRRKKRNLLARLGHKAKAIIATMKRKMAERPARPVLRPVPEGA